MREVKVSKSECTDTLRQTKKAILSKSHSFINSLICFINSLICFRCVDNSGLCSESNFAGGIRQGGLANFDTFLK